MADGIAAEKINRIIHEKQEFTVVFAGDSHTWGQGARGWRSALHPQFVAGEPRRLPESVPCFAQIFGQYLKGRRASPRKTNVVNSGYGCASTAIYLDRYWSRAVDAYHPDMVVLEFAINDWIQSKDVSLQDFGNNLNHMTDMAIGMGATPILLTVSPICGEQRIGDRFYREYIDQIYRVAEKRPDAVLADAYKRMSAFLDDGDRAMNEQALFDDVWHVNQTGHGLYCEALVRAIEGCLERE